MSQIIWQAVNNSQTLNLETEIHRIAELVTQIASFGEKAVYPLVEALLVFKEMEKKLINASIKKK